MRWLAVVAALLTAACGGSGPPEGPVDAKDGMMISNETVMSDAVADEAGANAMGVDGAGADATAPAAR